MEKVPFTTKDGRKGMLLILPRGGEHRLREEPAPITCVRCWGTDSSILMDACPAEGFLSFFRMFIARRIPKLSDLQHEAISRQLLQDGYFPPIERTIHTAPIFDHYGLEKPKPRTRDLGVEFIAAIEKDGPAQIDQVKNELKIAIK